MKTKKKDLRSIWACFSSKFGVWCVPQFFAIFTQGQAASSTNPLNQGWIYKSPGPGYSVSFFSTVGRVTECLKASFLQRPWLHDLGSTRTLATWLSPWIKRFMVIISAWWLWTSSKVSGQEFEEIYRNIGSQEITKQVRIPSSTK